MKNGTARKTESLSYPSNPLAAMRELQELDALPPQPGQERPQEEVSSPTTLQVAPTTSSQVGSAATVAEANATNGVSARAKAPARKKPRGEREGGTQDDSANPMERALLDMLASPYESDMAKGPFTVTTIKIPSELWERLGWLSQLTGQTKQEIIALALRERFEKVGNGK
jgi:hypothetical protein